MAEMGALPNGRLWPKGERRLSGKPLVYELITTARRYGALASEQGRLTVSWRVDTRDGDRRLVLDWFEQGLGPPEAEASVRRAYDRELIERALPYVLSGQGRYDVAETELRCSIDLPLTARWKSGR
ncbi:hypothetical protein U8607_04100 [Methylobacterium durans]|uniref:hypothetical protein n=1 Tax=Methylobacterium durans TaxID=2202825 RepID=UPI002AFED391|nr:hypothetical protein [Methylobacterium durans]MEA1831259.1 hypothetical protein [Methylobacterium durans]